jgi:hypothetical protein
MLAANNTGASSHTGDTNDKTGYHQKYLHAFP